MHRIITLLIITLSCTFGQHTFSQASKIPCSEEIFGAFDYWVGDWNVYDSSGKLIGTNKVEKILNKCVVQENWSSMVSSSIGTSFNYIDAKNNGWKQIWVDNSGFSLELAGGMVKGVMTMKSELQESETQNFYHLLKWTPNKDGSVTQVWTQVDEKGKLIKELFRGIYKRKTK